MSLFDDGFGEMFQKMLDDLVQRSGDEGLAIGIKRTLRLIFDEPKELREQCQMCKKDEHDKCFVHRTFFFMELSYDCNCSCQSASDLRQRLKRNIEALEKERLADKK